VLAWFRKREAVQVLAEQAPDLHEALEQAKADGLGVKGDQIDLWYSGKAHEHGGNVQALSAPNGTPLWVSDVMPGSVHDLTAARAQVLGALYWAASLTSTYPAWPTTATTAPGSVCTPRSNQPTGNRVLDVDTRTRNALLGGLRCLGERGYAVLTGR